MGVPRVWVLGARERWEDISHGDIVILRWEDGKYQNRKTETEIKGDCWSTWER